MSEGCFASGQCLCGKVKFSVSEAPVRMGQCHCEDCRRTTGTGHISNAFFEKKQVHIEGETNTYASVSGSGSTVTRHFCPVCASRLFSENSRNTSIMAITAGTFDDSHWFKANYIVFNKDKPVWDFMDESIPTFEKMPPIPK